MIKIVPVHKNEATSTWSRWINQSCKLTEMVIQKWMWINWGRSWSISISISRQDRDGYRYLRRRLETQNSDYHTRWTAKLAHFLEIDNIVHGLPCSNDLYVPISIACTRINSTAWGLLFWLTVFLFSHILYSTVLLEQLLVLIST